MTTDIADIVDLDRYPVAKPESPAARALVRTGRDRLAATGVFTLPGFIRPAALATMQSEADRLCPESFRRVDYRNGCPPGMGDKTRLSLGCVGYDQMSPGFSYDSAPDQQFGEDARMRFFGRRRPRARDASLRPQPDATD